MLHKKVLIIFGTTVIMILAILFFVLNSLFLDQFVKIERRNINLNLERTQTALINRISAINTIVGDWAGWDDTYNFILNPNARYINSNLTDATFKTLGINFIIYLDSSGRIVYERGFDIPSNREQPVPKSIKKLLSRQKTYFQFKNENNNLQGIILLPEGPMLIAAGPIIRSNGKGPVRGSLLMARYLDEDEIYKLGKSVHMPIKVTEFTKFKPSLGDYSNNKELFKDQDILVTIPDQNFINGYILIRDIFGAPALVIEVNLPQTILKQGKKSFNDFIFFLLGVVVFFGALFFMFLEKMVLTRLDFIHQSVGQIASSNDFSLRIPVSGNDELTSLVIEINRMMNNLEKSHLELEESKEQLKYLSLHDSLTGLYNRAFFEEEANRLEKGRYNTIGIIVCDLDGLKLVNDSLGHSAGDNLLKDAAQVLKESFRAGDIIARVGGDEFAILLPNNTQKDLENSMHRIQETISRYNAKNPEFPLSISIGYALRNENSPESMKEVFEEADNNMYREKLHRSQSIRSDIVKSLMKILEARDFITGGHAERLEQLITKMAKMLGFSQRTIIDMGLLAQFHDIGKVGIPDSILFKEGPLTPEERVEIQQHTEIGFRIAQSAQELSHISDWILKHHERWDGSGYPQGLKGEEIPLECRILAIADAYDAMTSDRPYRKAMPKKEAIMEIKKCSGTQFDPVLVEKFLAVIGEN